MDISILELRNAKALMVDREWLNGILPMAERILNGEIHTEKTEKRMQARVTMAGSGNVFLIGERTSGMQKSDRSGQGAQQMADGGDNENHGTQVQNNEAYLNIIYIEGMITRNGGACTYGSKQIRNLMMQASDDEDCNGHVWVIDTPGGVANAVSDFKMAVDYAHERGLMVDGIIDGCCASLGIYAGEMCDHLYYTSPTDRIGSVGTFGIFDVMKSGETDPTTGEKHYEIYDPESYDKNAGWRELAEEGKTDIIVADLKKHGAEFRSFIKSRRPKAKDEMLHGKLYECSEVDGILVDGQRTLQEVFQEVMSYYYQTHKDGQYDSVRMTAAQAKENILSPTNNSIMTENYQIIAQLAGAADGKFEKVDADGVYMNTSLLDTLQTNIEALQKEKADALALVESLTAEKDNLNAQIETIKTENAQAVENLNAEHQKAIDDLNAEHSKAIEDLNAKIADQEQDITAKEETIGNLQHDIEGQKAQIEQLQADVNGAKESLTTAENTIAERDQQITDLNAQLTELQNDPGQGAQAGAAPKNNGGGAEVPEVVVNQYVYDTSLTREQNIEAEKKWNEEHGK